MSEYRSILDRVADRAKAPDDAFERLQRRRTRYHRNRRITAGALALAVAAGGSLAAFAAFRNDKVPRPPFAGGSSQRFFALWPEQDLPSAREAQERVDGGDDQWRLDPEITAERFAADALGWTARIQIFQGVCTDSPLCPGPRSHFARLTLLRFEGDRRTEQSVRVDLRRLVDRGRSGIWSVTSVQTTRHLVSELQPGDVVRSKQEIRARSDFPDGTSIEAGVGWRTCTGLRSSSYPSRVVDGSATVQLRRLEPRRNCSAETLAPSTRGYVYFIHARGGNPDAYAELGISFFRRGATFWRQDPELTDTQVLDIAAVPVRIIFAEAEPTSHYPRGAFGWCPDVHGPLPFGSHAERDAARVALQFSRAFVQGRERAVRRLEDPSARGHPHQWAVAGEPNRMSVFRSSGNPSGPGLVAYGCGASVARRTWGVVIDDGTNSASADFTLYLVRRSDGWKVWGSY